MRYITIVAYRFMKKKNRLLIIILTLIVCIGSIKTYYSVTLNKFKAEIKQMEKNELLNFIPESIVENKSILSGENVIHYYTSGNPDNPVILFLHPAFSDHTCFYKQVDFFSMEFRVITIDLIGHGLSEVKNSKEKIDKSVEHIQEIMRIEGINSLNLVGVSMGSLIAQHFALQHSDKTLSLTCLGGYNINRVNKEVAKSQRKEMLGWMLRVIFSMDAFRQYAGSVSATNKAEQVAFYKSAQGFSRKSFPIMSGLGKLIKERSTPDRTYPLLILAGENDNELAKRIAKSWHEEEPQSMFHYIEKAGHCANMDNPETFNKLVYKMVKDIKR